jgi:hypothetical protein
MTAQSVTGHPGRSGGRDESGQVESVSRYVTEAVAFRRAREDGLAVLDRRFGKPPDYALEWARNLIARRLGSQGPAA